MAEHRPEDPLHRYAAVREAEHPWVIGEHVRAIDSLEGRELLTPAENLDRWQRWHEQGRTVLGPDHRETLRPQSEIARWTGETGNPREALRLLQRLLSDQSA